MGRIASIGMTAALALGFLSLAGAQGFDISPELSEKNLTQVSEHVYALVGFPNVGFVVGDQATLVVDTGLGPKNGALVAAVARRLSKGSKLYLTTTHFHPEHAAGDGGFPKETVLIRPRAQQLELDRDGAESLAMFRRNPQFAPWLEGATFRRPDVLFDRDYTLDLGHLHVQLQWIGPAHTVGDESIFVVEDRTLLSGDLGIEDQVPRNFAKGASAARWLAVLDRLSAMRPVHVVPDHGALGDASLLARQRAAMAPLAASEPAAAP